MLSGREELEAVRAAMKQIPGDYRQVLQLVQLELKPENHEEIKDRLEVLLKERNEDTSSEN